MHLRTVWQLIPVHAKNPGNAQQQTRKETCRCSDGPGGDCSRYKRYQIQEPKVCSLSSIIQSTTEPTLINCRIFQIKVKRNCYERHVSKTSRGISRHSNDCPKHQYLIRVAAVLRNYEHAFDSRCSSLSNLRDSGWKGHQ